MPKTMMKLKVLIWWAVFATLGAVSCLIQSAHADQQKWSSQYLTWTPDGTVKEVWNIDQLVWIPQPNADSYWPMQWQFARLGSVGYMGLQQADGGSQNVRFSIWNATAASGSSCKAFGGEGVGQTCTLPVKISTGKYYRLRLWRLDADKDGQWWGGWLIEGDGKGGLVEHMIGSIKAPAGATVIDPGSISNFAEYWGDAVPHCAKVPLSIVGFTPPAVNYKGKGTGVYEGHYRYNGSNKASGNHCSTGRENDGALISAKPFNFGFANGVMMFLGGTSAFHTLDPKKHPTPRNMPKS
jgi:hypothetical protein